MSNGDEELMGRAVAKAWSARVIAHPNPWVGCVIQTTDGRVFEGATNEVGGPHAEAEALAGAGTDARGGAVYVTLEPCSHHGRTPPCAQALVDAGVSRVVIGIEDPDDKVAGQGMAMLRAAGIQVDCGLMSGEIEHQLRPYLHHRRTGRPYVIAKVAMTLDGRTAAPDGTSQWITGLEARRDAHQLRAESDVIVVGSGTVLSDDPSLRVRYLDAPSPIRDPIRIVLGTAPSGSAVHPCRQYQGSITDLVVELGAEGHVQMMVEGGSHVLADFHRQNLIDQWVVYLAPALTGGNDSLGLFSGPGMATIADIWRGRFDDVRRIGADIRIDVRPEPSIYS